MSLKQKINQDIINSLKNNEKTKLRVLRFLNSQIKDKEINQGRKELIDKEIINLINSQIKKLKESIGYFKKDSRPELIEQANEEINILNSYLPAQINDQELEREIDQLMKENPQAPFPGIIIGQAVKKLSGRADSQRISQLVLKKFKRD